MSDAKIKIINDQAKVVGEWAMPTSLSEIKIKPAVVHQVVVAYQANRRSDTAHTKNRSEVRGGGKKPWKQKGTGRARQGSIRSPQWIGGGVVFGPRNERNHVQRLPAKLKASATLMVVKDYLLNNRVTVLQAWPQSPKTKDFVAVFKNLALPKRKALVILSEQEKDLRRGLQNIKDVTLLAVKQFNMYDGLRRPQWLISQTALQELTKRLAIK